MTGRDINKVNTAKSEIEQSGIKGSLSTLQLEVTDPVSIEKAVKYVQEKFGGLDVLILNAGVAPTDGTLKENLDTTLLINVTGAALVSDAFRPMLLKSKNPYTIYVSSGLGSLSKAAANSYGSMPQWMAYKTSKAALNMWATSEYTEFKSQGLKVFPMCPGLVVSNLRGVDEQQRQAGGRAGDPEVSGETILSIIEGKRDRDVGKFVHKDGVYEW